MASKKIPALVLVAAVILALSVGILSAFDGNVSGMGHGKGTLPLISEEPTVTPLEGKYTDWFYYTLVLVFYENATIELEIEKVGGGWEEIATREYNKSPNAQTLGWNVTPFSAAYVGKKPSYRFKWGNIVLDLDGETIFPGPTIVPELIYEFIDATVTPPSGYYNTSFTYSVEFKSNKNQSITLEVYNFSRGEWEETHLTRNYTDIGNPEVLSWSGISHFASNDSGYVLGKYRFSFMDYGERYESNIFRDPLLLPTQPSLYKIFKNATAEPSVGEYNTLFNYSVEIVNVMAVNITDVKLVVWNPHTLEEQEFKNATSDDSRLKWSIKPFEDDTQCKGFAGYYFKYKGKRWPETVLCYGPAINMTGPPGPSGSGGGGGGGGGYYKPWITYKNATVDPSWVSIGVRGKKSFNYSVVVDKGDPLVLEIYNLSCNNWEKVGEGNNRKYKDDWKHEWTVDLILNEDWAGLSKYWFYPEGGEEDASQIYYGPEIKMRALSEWKEEIGYSKKALKEPKIACDVTPGEGKWFTEFTYTANITHPNRVDMTAALFVYKPGIETWEPISWRGYRYNHIITSSDYDEHNTAKVRWSIEKMEIFNEADAGKESRYYIWYWDGDNEYNESSGYNEGPMLLANHEPELERALPPEPEYGSTHNVYEYLFEVSDPDDETVQGWLTVIDPFNEEHLISGLYKEGNLTFRVGPDLGIFTDLGEYKNFTSSYRLEYWDEGMVVMGKTKTTEWFVGPNVSLVKVQPYGEPPKPERGKYADEFEYGASFYSSRDNTIWSYLTIYDPSDPEHAPQTFATKNLSVASDTTGRVTWRVKPEVFGPDDFGMTARYEIAWEDQYGNKDVINETGPYIERAVPLLSVKPPLVPIVMVITPLLTFVLSLLIVAPGFWARLREWLRI